MSLKKKMGFKLLSGIVLLTMFLSILSPILFYPEPAQAQFTDVGHIAMQIGKWVWERVNDLLKYAWKVGGAVAYKNALNVYLGQMAQQSAEWVASGFKGQKPLFLTDPQYWKKAGDEALGEFIDRTAQASGFINQSLCDPLDAQLKFKLILSIPDISSKMPPVPQNKLCSLTKIKQAQSGLLKKNLVSFGIGTETSNEFGAKLAQLNQLYDADTSINQPTRYAINCFKTNINNSFNKITGYLSDINQKWDAGVIVTNESVWDNLKKETKTLQDLPNTNTCFTDVADPVSCSTASVNDFCSSQKCRGYCNEGLSGCGSIGTDCTLKYANCCKTQTNRAQTYFSQLLNQITEINGRVAKFITGVESQSYAGGGPNTTLEDLQKDMSASGSDLGALMTLSEQAQLEKAAREEEKKAWGLINGPMKGIESLVSGKIKTPSTLVGEQARQAVQEGTASVKQYTGVAAADAIGIFTNTLISKLLDKFKKGLNPSEEPSTSWSLDSSGKVVFNPGATESKIAMADLAMAPIRSGGQVDLLENYSSFIDKADYVLPDTNVIDAGFRRAIEEKMSISEAMEKNLLNKNWTVGEIGKADGFNDCNERFSSTNIKKLRRARVVSLGLEIAATKIASGELGNKNYTLKEIVDGFNQETSPFYHLVDPNWVLSMPQFFCEAKGYGAVPLGDSNQRQEVCSDLKDCLKTDEKGRCLGWGYCTREKNVWRFGGDECSKQYESCSTYKNLTTGEEKSFVKNTIDFSGCDQNSVGCKWYCKNYDKDQVLPGAGNKGIWACSKPEVADNQSNAIYFNKNISTCSSDNEGCHEYIQTTVNSGVNLIPNASFENYNVDNQGNLTGVNGWSVGGGIFLVDQTRAYSGKVVAKIVSAWGNLQISADAPLPSATGKQYTFSVWVKPENSITLHLFANPLSGGNAVEISQQGITNNWQRLVYTFDYPLIANGSELDVRTLRWEPGNDINGDVYFDDLQLEPGATTTTYKEYASINKIYLKTAPNYLKCGTINEDPVKCANFTKKCSATEVGCELYTSVSSGSAFPAIVKNEDKCPSDCVGYNTFRQSAINFESAVPFTNFISATGKSCPASDGGCEEFTNLDEVAKGGEGKEYYSYLRQCVKTDQNNDPIAVGQVVCTPYYTWIGSDTTGYQLKKYYLKQGADDAGPAVVSNPRLDLGFCNGADDISANPHCKQFYSATGEVYYRIYENTISCSQDCHPLRKTASIDSAYCPTDVPGTSYDATTGICTYMAIPSEGISCSKANVGCREYKGNNANNIKTLFNDQFETTDNSIALWTGDVSQSTESIKLGGHSMRVLSGNSISRLVKSLVKKDKSYLITFWIKGNGTYSAKFGSDLPFGSKSIASDEWQEIKLGPVNFSRDVDANESLFIIGSSGFYLDNINLQEIASNIYLIKNTWETPAVCDRDHNNNSALGFMVGCDSYKDRVGKISYLKSFSNLCPDDKVGCDMVVDTHNSSSPFSQEFNKIQGATTQNPDYANVPVDNVDYLVVDTQKICKAEFKGCQRFGLPALDINGAVVGWADQYLKNDPDLYDRRPILCNQNGQGCEEFFDASTNSKSYFRDPKDKLCEYRENVNIGSEIKSGWFKKGTDQACYYNTEEGPNKGKPYQPDGLSYGIQWAGESNYDNWVGVCPSSQNACTSFIDTQATAVMSLVKNGNFEDGSTISPWINETPTNFVAGSTITLDTTGTNKSAYIDSSSATLQNAFEGMGWTAAGIGQTVEPSLSLSGSSYVLKGRAKIDQLLTALHRTNVSYMGKSIAQLVADLSFEGNPDAIPSDGSNEFIDGEWRDWAACYRWNGANWVAKDVDNNGTPDCVDALGTNPSGVCSYDQAVLNGDPAPLAKCVLGLKIGGFDVMNSASLWAWVYVHGYLTTPTVLYVEQGNSIVGDGSWHDFSQVITASGIYNPRSLRIKRIHVAFRIVDQSYLSDTLGRGEASLDDIEFKQLEPYYYINNTKLDRTSCNGQVSPKAGCILFADSSLKDYHSGTMPFTYNSIATYKKSEHEKYNLVTPVDCTKNGTDDYTNYCAPFTQTTNDTNAIIKVVRDRECGEWLTCADSTSQWSKTENRFKNVCNYVLRCDQLSDNAGTSCAHPVVTNNPEVLSEAKYKLRDVSWSGMDYSGYSLYKMYPVEYLAPKQIKTIVGANAYYAYELTHFDGNTEKGIDGGGKTINKTCRLYPEIDSPFTPDLAEKYKGINICQPDSTATPNPQTYLYRDCQCAYGKGDYLGTMKYFNYGESVWPGISSDESQIKKDPCSIGDPDCIKLKKKTNAIGQRGYCLERDLSVPGELNSCLTWWPGAAAIGDPDIYNQYTSAGYVLESQPDQPYCVNYSGQYNYGLYPNQLNHIDFSGCNWIWQPTNSPLQIYADEIDHITISLGADDNRGDRGNDVDARIDTILTATGHVWRTGDAPIPWYACVDDAGDLCYSSTMTGAACENIDCPEGGTIIRAKAIFGVSGEFQSILISYRDRSSGDGGTVYWGNIVLYTKSGCQYIMNPERDSGTFIAKGWTDRLWNVGAGAYTANATNPTSVLKTRQCSSFGRIGNSDIIRLNQALINTSATACTTNETTVVHNITDINNLFVKFKEAKQINSDITYSTCPSGNCGLNLDVSNNLAGTVIPSVASVKCEGGELSGEGSCKLDKIGEITINDQVGDIGSRDNPITGGIYPVALKFYAWADKNHMPIREVLVDWGEGDGTPPSGSSTMLAKNHKPLCCESNNSCTNLSKISPSPVYGDCAGNNCLNFGNVPDVCSPNYFQFNHLYHCESAQCQFKPTVYVKDNWGWCNGIGTDLYARDSQSCVNKTGTGTSFSGSIFLSP